MVMAQTSWFRPPNKIRAFCLIVTGMLAATVILIHLSSNWRNEDLIHLIQLSSNWKNEDPPPAPTVPLARPCPRGVIVPEFATTNLRYDKPSALTGRTDIVAMTPWLAPIVWQSTFEPALLDAIYKPCNITVAVTVFAIGKYIQFLKDFLETAESHFFVGFKVHYYVFTDGPEQVPSVKMAAGRELFVRPAPNGKRWQEIGAGRFKSIANFIETDLRDGADYIYCFDVDSKFYDRWGTETLGKLVAVLHFNVFDKERSGFIYERRPESKAFMSADEGDFYYPAGAYGGEPESVRHMLSTCSDNFELDAQRGIEAAWQEESHMNVYLWLHKPTKILSPEYQWHDVYAKRPPVKIIRFSAIIKDYRKVRPGWSGGALG